MEITELSIKDMILLPPDSALCQICAYDHKPELPHCFKSLYYQYHFLQKEGRWPTWADAMAHCSEEMKKKWIKALGELRAKGIDIGPLE